MSAPPAEVHGLLLAAGAGSRMGRPKALVEGWLGSALDALRAGGCARTTVVLGARAEQARGLVPDGVDVVVAEDWADGMAASLRAGLRSLAGSPAVAAVLTLVDLPDVGADVVARLAARAAPDALARATYDGRPGHPVLMGRDHWEPAAAAVRGDEGARIYLARHGVVGVPCEDLASGRDVDRPGGLSDAGS